MNTRLFQLFYDKLPVKFEDILPKFDRCFMVTCLTPYYMMGVEKSKNSIYEEFDVIGSDGFSPLAINKWMGKPKSIRVSFDMSSMAKPVFESMMKEGHSLYVLGSAPGDAEKCVGTIKVNFPNIDIAGTHHGFIKDCKQEVVDEIISTGAKVVIIGMGAPLQDEMAVMLKKSGYIGSVYTCGGFIHQTTENMISFPEWTNKYNVRFVYRWFHEKGVFARMPKQILGLICYAWWVLTKCKI